jgi:hypothetical protein
MFRSYTEDRTVPSLSATDSRGSRPGCSRRAPSRGSPASSPSRRSPGVRHRRPGRTRPPGHLAGASRVVPRRRAAGLVPAPLRGAGGGAVRPASLEDRPGLPQTGGRIGQPEYRADRLPVRAVRGDRRKVDSRPALARPGTRHTRLRESRLLAVARLDEFGDVFLQRIDPVGAAGVALHELLLRGDSDAS